MNAPVAVDDFKQTADVVIHLKSGMKISFKLVIDEAEFNEYAGNPNKFVTLRGETIGEVTQSV